MTTKDRVSPPHRAIKEAVAIAGGQSALAKALQEQGHKEIKQSHIWNWLNRDKQAPGYVCLDIQAITKKQITAKALRPDIFK